MHPNGQGTAIVRAAGGTTTPPAAAAPATQKSDKDLRNDVLSELDWDPFVLDAPVEVAVEGGVVTVHGTANSLANRDAINEAVRRVDGVRGVVDHLTVQPDRDTVRTDDDLRCAVRDALAWNAAQPGARMSGTVAHGTVTLHGAVDTWTQRADAERRVRALAGVRAVDNRITVRPSPLAPAAMRFLIERAIERHAGRTARPVHVEVSGDVVTLEGRVRTWSERQALERIAGAMEGIRDVRNRLEVVSG